MSKRKSKKTRAEPQTEKNYVGLWMAGKEDILRIPGYTPLAKNEEIRRCVHKVANLVSSMTIKLYENGENGDHRIKNELSRKIDINPNKYLNRKNFIYRIVTDMMIYGNSVLIPHYKGIYLDDLEICKMDSVSFRDTDGNYQIWYKGKVYDPDEVIHIPWIPDDDKPWQGQGYALMFKEVLMNLAQANATKTGFLKSKWKPSVIISIESDIEELQDGEKRKQIINSYTDDTEAGEPWLIPAGEIEVKEIRPLTLNDLAIQDSITLDKKTVAACIGMPSFMVGIGEFKKDAYNNFINNEVMGFAEVIAQKFTSQLLLSPHWYFKFSRQSLMQYDLAELSSFTNSLVQIGSLNRNEQRGYFDLEPKEGLDEYTPLENYIPVADLGNQKKLNKGGDDDE